MVVKWQAGYGMVGWNSKDKDFVPSAPLADGSAISLFAENKHHVEESSFSQTMNCPRPAKPAVVMIDWTPSNGSKVGCAPLQDSVVEAIVPQA